MVELFSKRDLIADVLSLGQVFLFAAPVAFGYLIAKNSPEDKRGTTLLKGFLTGAFAAIPLIILTFLATSFDLRQFLPNVSPALIEILTFGLGTVVGSLV